MMHGILGTPVGVEKHEIERRIHETNQRRSVLVKQMENMEIHTPKLNSRDRHKQQQQLIERCAQSICHYDDWALLREETKDVWRDLARKLLVEISKSHLLVSKKFPAETLQTVDRLRSDVRYNDVEFLNSLLSTFICVTD